MDLVITCCIILHNMMVEVRLNRDEEEDYTWYDFINNINENNNSTTVDPAIKWQEAERALHQCLQEAFYDGPAVDVDENNYIKRVSIKKPFSDVENKHAIIGTMYFKKAKYFKIGLDKIYEINYKTNNEFYIDNMIEPLVNMGYKIKIFDVKNYLCWGTPNDYKTYNYWLDYLTKLK